MKKIILLTVGIAFIGCKTTTPTAANPDVANQRQIKDIELNGKVYAAVYQQRAAEYKALCLQAFNVAKYQLDAELQKPHSKPLAIVTDVDETVVDNSPYAVEMAKLGQVYQSPTWHKWTAKGIAEPLAGSVEFLTYAASKGVHIFYITNRNNLDKPGTVANLKKYNFPFADESHVIVKDKESSKEPRRLEVAKTYDIVLFMGDNLGDFSNLFEDKTEAEREKNVFLNASEFGKRFIVLPNPGYGDWEGAIFDYKYSRNFVEKDSIYLSKVKG